MRADMPDHCRSGGQGKRELPCAVPGLSTATLGVIDPFQLDTLIALVRAVGSPAMLANGITIWWPRPGQWWPVLR